MVFITRPAMAVYVSLLLSACGGGSSSSDSGTTPIQPTPTPSNIIANAKDYSVSELNTEATKLVDTRYSGLTTDATIDVVLAQKAFISLFDDSSSEIPEIGDIDFRGSVDANGALNTEFLCEYEGKVTYKGQLNSNFEGNISLSYHGCRQGYYENAITGSAAINITKVTETSSEITYYFDNLSWQTEKDAIKLTGYSNIVSMRNNAGDSSYRNKQHLLFTTNNIEQVLLEAELAYTYENEQSNIELTGDLFFREHGKIAIEIENMEYLPPYTDSGRILLSGSNKAAFEFESPYIRYVEDSTGDQQYDVGVYFVNADELLYGQAYGKNLVALAELSLPPTASRPGLNYSDKIDTTTPIEVYEGYYSDPDTPYEDLEVSYRWYLNGEVINGQTTNILPPYIAVYEDDLKVSMLVSDGANVTESQPRVIELQDAPLQIEVSNLPDGVNAGDIVQFTVQISDPDTQSVGQNGTLISGPDGSTIDENGLVNWLAPNDLLFPYQMYAFNFGMADADGVISDEISVEVKVESSKAFPIARSGIEVPSGDKSMSVGDFDGDGENEVLSTDGIASVFLLEFQDGKYQQQWAYPFKPKADGRIIQVLSTNTDDDNADEILVVTEKGMSVINGLNNLDTLLLSTTDYILFATVTDIDDDGVPEIAYLHSSNQHSSDVEVTVFSMDEPTETHFTTNLGDAKQVIFSDVDNDENIELISNNGLVYDASTWANQWISSNQFGDTSITSGDYNGDGINEIAGANGWGTIAIYSAVNKSQLDSLDNFNTCTLHSDDVDSDGKDEFLVGDCQWGEITAYKLIDNKLTSLWSVDMQGHGSSSLTTGDSDNDGKLEIHWGTGTSSSGEDGFITADVAGYTASIKENSTSIQLDSYSSAGWAKVSGSEEEAVFYIPSSGSGYDGSRVITMDSTGSFDVSAEISSNWDNSSYAVTTDYNNDGFGDIFLPNTSLYTGSFAVMQLHDNVIQWQYSASGGDSTIGVIKANDINADTFEDAIFADGRVVRAIDVQNQTIIASYTFDHWITDIAPLRVDNKPSVIVAAGDKLSLLTANASVFSEQSFVEQSCTQILLINYDTDADTELLCLAGEAHYSKQQFVIFEIEDSTLVEVLRSDLSQNFESVVVDPSKTQEQNILASAKIGQDSSWDNTNSYTIKKLTSTGKIIWGSPDLVGQPTRQGLKARNVAGLGLELMLSTQRMMYWIK
jgi:hypothetical protein